MPTQPYHLKDGTKVPGNTTVIGGNLGWKTGGLVHWAWNLGMQGLDYRKVRDEAGGLGTLAHARIEAEIHSRPTPDEAWFWDWIKDDEQAMKKAKDGIETIMLGFYEWRDSAQLEITGSEIPLICECHQYGTTIDHPAIVKGRRVILELKTSNDVYPDMWIQMAAQGHAWDCSRAGQNGETLVAGFHLLHIGKDHGGFDHKYRPSLPQAWAAFLHLRGLHGLKKEIK